MPILIIKLKVKDKIDAYKVVNRLGCEFEVLEADFDEQIFKFNNKIESKKPSFFLREEFGKKLK